MKLSTAVIPTVEMTREEQRQFWPQWVHPGFRIEGKRVTHWMTDDGHNDILLEGETVYRAVVIKDSHK